MAQILIQGRFDTNQDLGIGLYGDVIYDLLADSYNWSVNTVSVIGNGFGIVVNGSNNDNLNLVSSTIQRHLNEGTGLPTTILSTTFLTRDASANIPIQNPSIPVIPTTAITPKPSTGMFQQIADDLKVPVIVLGMVGVAVLLVVGQKK